jgi:hypothetical protein
MVTIGGTIKRTAQPMKNKLTSVKKREKYRKKENEKQQISFSFYDNRSVNGKHYIILKR